MLEYLHRRRLPHWERDTLDVVARLRAAYARAEFRSEIEPVVTALQLASPDFAAAWRRRVVVCQRPRPRVLKHPALGQRTYLLTALFTADDRGIAYLVHAPLLERESAQPIPESSPGP